MYIDKFTDFKTYVDVAEHRIMFDSKIPDKEDIINYGLPKNEQKIRRTQYEFNGKMYDACDFNKKIWMQLPRKLQDQISDTEWHRRKNGCWYYVNGKTIYLTGEHYFFINYYSFDDGTKPSFWDSQWFDFHLIHDSFFSPKVLGIFKVKGRRGGGTAVANCCCLDYCTRFRGSKGGNINKTEDDAESVNFAPIRNAFLNLPYFFLPKPYRDTIGEEKRRMKTEKALEFKGADKDEINSMIDYRATTEKGYDGGKMRWLTMDEYAKLKNLDITSSIRTNVLCVMDGGIKHNVKDKESGEVKKFASLLYLVSSIDEISEEQLGRVNSVYETCSPDTATDKLCSTHGIRRYFEPFYFGFNGYMDEFGFSKAEECRKAIDNQYNMILKVEGKSQAREFRRQHPETIEDALTPSSNQCVFNVDILIRAKKIAESRPINDPMRPIRGRLDWIKKFESVMWTPMPEAEENDIMARFVVSGQPIVKNHIQRYLGEIRPASVGKYIMSVDPIDYDKKDTSEKSTRLSRPACRVKRLYDAALDGTKFDDEGNPIDFGLGFESNRTVLTYLYRPELASEFYEDMAKVAIYYGTPLLTEKSISFRNFMIDNNMGYFLYDNNCEFYDENNYNSLWISTTDENKRQFFSDTSTYIGRFGLAERHIECIDQLSVVTPKTMTKFDLASAYVIGEYADSTLSRKLDSPVQNIEYTGLIFGNQSLYR